MCLNRHHTECVACASRGVYRLRLALPTLPGEAPFRPALGPQRPDGESTRNEAEETRACSVARAAAFSAASSATSRALLAAAAALSLACASRAEWSSSSCRARCKNTPRPRSLAPANSLLPHTPFLNRPFFHYFPFWLGPCTCEYALKERFRTRSRVWPLLHKYRCSSCCAMVGGKGRAGGQKGQSRCA
eukprot:5602680-Pleurochrysis_carterae.AAC.1